MRIILRIISCCVKCFKDSWQKESEGVERGWSDPLSYAMPARFCQKKD